MQQDGMQFSRIIIAALRGGSGKTILSVGLIAALGKTGHSVAPFKKGPDYIDAGWLALAAGRSCYNLDSYLLSPKENLTSFCAHSREADIAVIEGNRGLYDGIDLAGSTSTAELAKLLGAPVVLCVDCTKITRTMAAMIAGCLQFDRRVMIRGVVLNRVANPRHEKKLRESIEHYCGIPVLGALPKLKRQLFPERHLGLVPTPEHGWAADSIAAMAEIASGHIDLQAVADIARQAPELRAEIKGPRTEDRDLWPADQFFDRESRIQHRVSGVEGPETGGREPVPGDPHPKPRIGILKDSAFQFYYPENIEALAAQGAEILYLSPLAERNLPDVDGLYIGGGFPETHAEQLAANKSFSARLKAMVEAGLPVYAECGGLMYLGQALVLDGKPYSMSGILPVVFDFYKRPQGHGYTAVTVERKNPYFEVGTEIRGHEFHYSRVAKWDGEEKDLVFRMKRGVGITADRDGIVYKNVLATYTHIHALGTPDWAQALVRNAIKYQKR